MSFDGNLQSVADYEHHCRQSTTPAMYEYLYGEVGDPEWSTLTNNRAALDDLRLRPRVLVDVSERRLRTTALGTELSLPVVVGPTGIISDLDPEAETSTVRGAGAAETLFVLSSFSSVPPETVAAAATGPWWQQVFIYRDRGLTDWQIERAVELGAGAIVVTVSNTGDTWHHQTMRFLGSGGSPQPAANVVDYPGPAVPDYVALTDAIDEGATWADIDHIRGGLAVPLVVKGVQTAADATLAVEHGAGAIVVSNHGGRFLQGARGTVAALPEIVDAVDGRAEVYVDGGFRHGEDVLKALALGARAVWIGRAARWAQAVAGEKGVTDVVEVFRRELRGAMGLCGVADVTAVDPALVGP